MIIVKKIDQYDENYVFFCDPIKNNVMNDGNFIRIIYSTNNIILNGIYLLLNLTNVTCENYYNKYKCTFNTNINKNIIEKMKLIEYQILKKCNITNKQPKYQIYEQLNNGFFKLFNDTCKATINESYILKIAGVWETSNNYGLTYKFFKSSSLT